MSPCLAKFVFSYSTEEELVCRRAKLRLSLPGVQVLGAGRDAGLQLPRLQRLWNHAGAGLWQVSSSREVRDSRAWSEIILMMGDYLFVIMLELGCDKYPPAERWDTVDHDQKLSCDDGDLAWSRWSWAVTSILQQRGERQKGLISDHFNDGRLSFCDQAGAGLWQVSSSREVRERRAWSEIILMMGDYLFVITLELGCDKYPPAERWKTEGLDQRSF